jgi:hypothetical protein
MLTHGATSRPGAPQSPSTLPSAFRSGWGRQAGTGISAANDPGNDRADQFLRMCCKSWHNSHRHYSPRRAIDAALSSGTQNLCCAAASKRHQASLAITDSVKCWFWRKPARRQICNWASPLQSTSYLDGHHGSRARG